MLLIAGVAVEEKRITIKELSKIIGVSEATISNALTGKPNVSDTKRAQIIEWAKHLGYRPNLNARAMSKNGVRIGMMVSIEPAEHNADLIRGIRQMIDTYSDFKVELVDLCYSNVNMDDEVYEKVKFIKEYEIDGLVIAPSLRPQKYTDQIKRLILEENFPVVFCSSWIEPGLGIACVDTNPVAMGRMAGGILSVALPLNSDVAAITTSKYYQNHSLIVSSFREECERQGLNIVATMENNDSPDTTRECAKTLTKIYPNLKAIYVTSYSTIPVCQYIEEAGLQGRIKIVGQDVFPGMVNYIMNNTLLASLFQDPQEKGRTSIRLLVEAIIGNKREFQDVSIRPQLVMQANIDLYV